MVGTQEWQRTRIGLPNPWDELHKSFTNTFGNVDSSSDIPAIKWLMIGKDLPPRVKKNRSKRTKEHISG